MQESALMLNTAQPMRKMLYTDILSQCRVVMIESMVRPEEVCYLQISILFSG
jgi:hypothetical protein